MTNLQVFGREAITAQMDKNKEEVLEVVEGEGDVEESKWANENGPNGVGLPI